jgi:hypothetical protein
MNKPNLSTRQLESMALVVDGADVHNYGIAVDLRGVEQSHPELITITQPQAYEGDGMDQVPYLGVILTDLGRQCVSTFLGNKEQTA